MEDTVDPTKNVDQNQNSDHIKSIPENLRQQENLLLYKKIDFAVLIITAFIGSVLIASIAVVLSERKHKNNPPLVFATTDQVVESLNFLSLYPNGSSIELLTSYVQVSTNNSMVLLPLNSSVLRQISSIDESSLIVEAGRDQYMYFQIPSGVSVESIGSGRKKRQMNPEILSVSAIAVQFGAVNEKGIVIPLVAPGVDEYSSRLADGSKILRIKLKGPSNMCTSQPDSCKTIDYHAYTVFNDKRISSFSSSKMTVACGDVCSISSSNSDCSASCGAVCDGAQTAGALTPVTRRYNMKQKSATFKFIYQTYQVEDRILVTNDRTTLLDTGCVGTNGEKNINLTLSGDSPTIRVDVMPGCNCGGPYGCLGTAWHFTVFCPVCWKPPEYECDSSYKNPTTVQNILGSDNRTWPVIPIIRNHLTTPSYFRLSENLADNTIGPETACSFDLMRQAALLDGVTLTINSGFRTLSRQEYFYYCYMNREAGTNRCKGAYNGTSCTTCNLAANPGTSNHGRNMAIDLNVGSACNDAGKSSPDVPPAVCYSDDVYSWLNDHAERFKFYRTIKSETWHWEYRTSGASVPAYQPLLEVSCNVGQRQGVCRTESKCKMDCADPIPSATCKGSHQCCFKN